MKTTRTMKAPFNTSFTNTIFSFRSAGVDRFRLLWKGWSVKVLSLLLVLMVGGSLVGQVSATSTWALTANANALTTGAVSGGLQTGGSGISAMTYGTNGVTSNGWGTTGIDANDYYQFNISPTSGNNLTISSVATTNNLSSQTATGEIQYSYSSSFTTPSSIGGTFALTSTVTTTTVSSLSISVTNGQTLYVRVFIYKGSGNTITSSQTVRCKNFTITGTTAASGLTPPTLTAASPATVDGNFDITFTNANGWASNVTGITVGGTTLSTSAYTVGSNIITFKPSLSSLLQSAGSKSIVVSATGFTTATVSQNIGFGAATKLVITSHPTAPASNGAVLATQPVIAIQDQYGNTVTTSSASVTAAKSDAGNWTLGGTTGVAASSGVVTFAGLTATSSAAVNNATLNFTSSGLTASGNSNSFNIPVPAPANDLCSGSTSLTPGTASTSGTLTSATNTTNTFTYGSSKNDVWYTFTPTCTGNHTVTLTFSSGPDIDIDLFNTSCPTTGTATNTSHGSTTTEAITASLVSGTVYYVRVIDWNTSAGTFSIGVSGPTPVTQTVTTHAATTITATTATLNGTVTAVGVCPSTIEKGFVYSTTSVNNDPVNGGTGVTKTTVGTGSVVSEAYTLALTGLTTGTGYSFKSYVFDGSNYTYGLLTTFTTVLNAPTVSTTVAANTITDISASSGGQTITGSLLSAKGVVWNTSATPTVALTTKTNDGTSTANFTSSLASLSPQTQYYVRAYATNAAGTGYGTHVIFRTLSSPASAQASAFSASATSTSNIDLSWSSATFPSSGATTMGYLLYRASATNTASFSGSNGTAPSAGANTTLVTTLGSNSVSYSNANLDFSTAYNYLLIPFTWDGTNAATYNYLTASAVTASATTQTPTTPLITTSGSLSALSTTYGTASSTSTFSVGGAIMDAGITITPPLGFEISTSSTFSSNIGNNSSPIVIGSAGTIASTPIYVRLLATAGFAGSPYSGNITLSSINASDVNVATISSTVAKKGLILSGLTANDKVYDGSTSVSVTGTATYSGLVNSESFTVTDIVSWAFTTNGNVGVGKAITQTGTYTVPSINYSITQPTLTATITSAPLTITASAQSKNFGVTSTTTGATSFTTSGLQGSDAVGTVTLAYSGSPAGNLATATAGSYTITPSAASFTTGSGSNYTITYTTGSLTISAVVPGAPTIGAPTAGNGQVTIAFTAPASNGGSVITSYTAISSPGGFTGTVNQATSGSIVVNGLTNGTPYTFTVTATNGAGTSTASNVSNSVTPVFQTEASDYFRSKISGTWADAGTWESSVDGSTNWITATLAPNNYANTVVIRNGHTITNSSTVTIDQVIVQSGGILTLANGGTATIENGSGDDVVIQDGGRINYQLAPTYNSSTIRINGGGILSIEVSGVTANGAGVNASSHIYDNAAILQWNLTTTNPSSSGVTYFPNVTTEIPIFRFASGTNSAWGANSPTIVNGKVEILNGIVITLNGSATKTFKYGLSGAGTLNQGASGTIIFSGSTAEIGGTSKITLSTNGLTVSSNLSVTGTIDCGANIITGTGTFTLSSGATLKTSHASGLNGAITVSGTKTFSSLANYEFNGTTSGTFPTTPTANTVNNLTINRSAGVTLSQSFTTIGTLTLTSGTLDIGANTLTIAGSVSRTNGNIDADAGTVSFTNANDLNLPTSLFSGNIYNLSKPSGAGTVTLDDNLTVTNQLNTTALTGAIIIASSKELAVSGTGKATINGTITNNGTFTLNSGATLLQGSNSSITGGTYNVKQTITGAGTTAPTGRFWYLGSPVSGATSAVYDAAGANILKYYSEHANGWQEITDNSAALAVGKGYFVQATAGMSELNFTGGTINNGDYTLSVTRNTSTNAFRGYNLLTNPYPSYLDWDNVSRSNVGSTIWYRAANSAGTMVFDTYNAPAGTGTNINGSGAVTKFIPPMQSFWVNVPQGQAAGTVSFGNDQRSHYSTGVQGLRSTAQDFPAFLRLNLLDGSFVDQTILYMKPDANNTFDEYDSEKMFLGGVPQFYSTVNAKKLVLNGMKNQKARTSVPLTMELPTSKSYTFQAEEFNIEDGLILLEDKQEGVIQDLTINPTYSFFGNAGTNATRFVVHFQLANAPVLVGGPLEFESLGSEDLTTDNIQFVSNNQGTVIVRLDEGFKPEGSIRIFDASGRLVEQTDLNDQETTIQLNEQTGMYFVEVAAGKLMVKKKIVIE